LFSSRTGVLQALPHRTCNYLGLQPGVSKNRRHDFIGLENPPPTPPGVPGLRFKLTAAQASGLGPGASIIYKGITVGLLETRVFHPDSVIALSGA
jgi:paraquat-inducible protein B